MTASTQTKSAAAALLGLNSKVKKTAAVPAVSTSPRTMLSSEQEDALSVSSHRTVITALAGAGKSRVLAEYAQRNPNRKWSYLAFNKAMAQTASREMPSADCRTLHSLAYSRFGAAHEDRIGTPWVLENVLKWAGQDASPALAALWVSVVFRFIASSDKEIGVSHIPFADWKRWQEKSGATSEDAKQVVAAATRIWEGMITPGSDLPMELDATVKLMQLSGLNPFSKGASLLVDEAQDLTPCIRSWLDGLSLPIVRAGDPYQSIYGWRMQGLSTPWLGNDEVERWLCGSWRFGHEVAALASRPLAFLGCPHTISGLGGPTKVDSSPTTSGVLLARTRSGLLEQAIKEASRGRKLSLEYAPWLAQALKSAPRNDEFVDTEDKSWERTAIDHKKMLSQSLASDGLVLMTAHASKGGTFESVRLADDFSWPPKRQSEEGSIAEEARVLYVALTRAKHHLSVPDKLLASLNASGDVSSGASLEDDGF
jgi:hypothetical protein